MVTRLPRRAVGVLCQGLGVLAWLVLGRERELCRARLVAGTGGPVSGARVRAAFLEAGATLADTLALLDPAEEAGRTLAIDPAGRKAFREALAEGRGVVFVSGAPRAVGAPGRGAVRGGGVPRRDGGAGELRSPAHGDLRSAARAEGRAGHLPGPPRGGDGDRPRAPGGARRLASSSICPSRVPPAPAPGSSGSRRTLHRRGGADQRPPRRARGGRNGGPPVRDADHPDPARRHGRARGRRRKASGCWWGASPRSSPRASRRAREAWLEAFSHRGAAAGAVVDAGSRPPRTPGTAVSLRRTPRASR